MTSHVMLIGVNANTENIQVHEKQKKALHVPALPLTPNISQISNADTTYGMVLICSGTKSEQLAC